MYLSLTSLTRIATNLFARSGTLLTESSLNGPRVFSSFISMVGDEYDDGLKRRSAMRVSYTTNARDASQGVNAMMASALCLNGACH